METICERASLVKKTLHIYGWLFLAWLLFLILYGGYEVAEKGAAINKAVVLVILKKSGPILHWPIQSWGGKPIRALKTLCSLLGSGN